MADLAPEHPTRVGGRAAYYALAVVGLAQALALVDRQVLAILVPRIKADLHVGDAEMGLLYGSVFALFYALFSLPMGRIADGWIRTRLLGIAILGWSLMTALAGFAGSFPLLALSRLGVGVGEAAVQPAGMSLLADRFARHQKGRFTAGMAAATALGLGSALWIGGATAGWWDAHFAPGTAPLGLKGWQAAFIAAALPGPILALALFTMQEPTRGAADGVLTPPDPHPIRAGWNTLGAILPGFAWIAFARRRAPASTWIINIVGLAAIIVVAVLLTRWTDSLRAVNPITLQIGSLALDGNALQWLVAGFGGYVLLCWLQSLRLKDAPTFTLLTQPAMLLTLALAVLQIIINNGMMGFTASFIIREFHANPAAVGLKFGLLSAAVGVTGPLIGGLLSDALAKRRAGGRIYVTLGALAISPFFAFLVYRAQSEAAFYFWFVFYSITLTQWMPPVYATILDLVLPRMRGLAMSFYMLITTILGLGIGPYAVGLISDTNGGDLGSAILSLYWLAPAEVVLAILLIRRLRADGSRLVDRARAAGEPL
jgi:MFS family permease